MNKQAPLPPNGTRKHYFVRMTGGDIWNQPMTLVVAKMCQELGVTAPVQIVAAGNDKGKRITVLIKGFAQ
jgi:hypothetical protein